MPPAPRARSGTEVDAFAEAFEAAWFRDGGAELADFLPPRDHPAYPTVLRELACIDMELAHARGQPRSFADYRDRFPELGDDPVAVTALAEQEARLQAEAQPPPPAAARLGWREQAAALYDAYRADTRVQQANAIGSAAHADLILELQNAGPDSPRWLDEPAGYPKVGATFAGFRLLRELGRGTFGRVFLAEQAELANRRVALKVGHQLFDESQTLAHLQHANIVPIHSAHQEGPLQAVCMPFLGSTTLGDVLGLMRRQGGAPASGNALWSTLHHLATTTQPVADPPAIADSTDSDPPRRATASLETLRQFSQVRAVLWIAARLADGLAHAHGRGIVHRDLKPANVLLADDGTPLLLDFNLSADVRLRGGVPALLGGTLPYMSPEHLEAFQGGTRPVDPRSDIYSLGVVLYELLTGRHPFLVYGGPLRDQVPHMIADRLKGAPAAREHDKAVSPAVDAILRRCLEPDPARRYQKARDLQEDAERQLADLPLRHAPEPSRWERLGKFLRRYPRLVWAGIAAALACLALVVGLFYVLRGRHVDRVEAVNTRQAFVEELRDARILIGLPEPDLVEWAEGQALGRRALGRYGLPDGTDWARSPLLTALPRQEQEAHRADLGELLVLLARADRMAGRLDEALRLNALAGELAGERDNRAVLLQRAWLMRLAGRDAEAADLLRRGREVAPRTGRDYYMLACELSTQGEVREAARMLDEATRLEPSNAAWWAAWGACYAVLGQHDRAASAFTTCIALRPRFWRGYLWRGQAYLELKEFNKAEADLDEVLTQRPGFVPALVYRALARLGKKDLAGAEADLTAALKDGAVHTRLYFMRARVRRQAGDAAGAKRDLEEGLRRRPADELSWIARGLARLPGDPPGALADFDEALKLNAGSREATQNKAHVLAEYLKRPDEAIAALDGVIRRYPDFTEARVGRGVLHARLGQRRQAIDDAAESLRRDTRPLIVYQAGCIYALTSRREKDDRLEAFRLLTRAVRGGFGAEHVESDADLAPLRDDAEYRRLVELAGKLRNGRSGGE